MTNVLQYELFIFSLNSIFSVYFSVYSSDYSLTWKRPFEGHFPLLQERGRGARRVPGLHAKVEGHRCKLLVEKVLDVDVLLRGRRKLLQFRSGDGGRVSLSRSCAFLNVGVGWSAEARGVAEICLALSPATFLDVALLLDLR